MASGGDSLSFGIGSGVQQRCALSHTLFNHIIDRIRDQALQGYPGVQADTNVNVSDPAYADNIVLLSNSYREMQSLLEVVNCHAAAVGMCICALNGDVSTHPW